MSLNPTDFATIQRDRLRAQADVFATLASHGPIVGTAREIALIEFLRGLIPRRFEVLSGAIVETSEGKISKASKQMDVLVVDTFEYPTLVRTGDLAIVLPDSVRCVVEVKSDLERGESFFDALEQIGQARLLAVSNSDTNPTVLTALFCFASPTQSATLRKWLDEMLQWRARLIEWAAQGPGERDVKETNRPKKYQEASKEDLITKAAMLSAGNLPDLILTDKGAIAMRNDLVDGKPYYDFLRQRTLPLRS